MCILTHLAALRRRRRSRQEGELRASAAAGAMCVGALSCLPGSDVFLKILLIAELLSTKR